MSEWTKFFAVRLPVAILAFGLAIEAAAALLSGVTLHRHNVDDLASAVMHDTRPYRTVLLGDSVTHMVATQFRIGDADEVADLTTHAYAGLPSELFLLKRYLESGHRPRHVVLAVSRHLFTEPMDNATFSYYITSVFKLPNERAFLQRYYSEYVNYEWRPAALSMTTTVGEPILSLLRHPGNQIWSSPERPSPNPSLEHIPGYSDDEGVFQKILSAPTDIRPEARAVITEMCRVSQRYQFSLHIVWAPLEPRLRAALIASGAVPHIDDQLREIFRQNQTAASIVDSSDRQDYPYFDHALIHIRGLGWEQVYANELAAYIHDFEAH